MYTEAVDTFNKCMCSRVEHSLISGLHDSSVINFEDVELQLLLLK